jgi:hypothetical protein
MVHFRTYENDARYPKFQQAHTSSEPQQAHRVGAAGDVVNQSQRPMTSGNQGRRMRASSARRHISAATAQHCKNLASVRDRTRHGINACVVRALASSAAMVFTAQTVLAQTTTSQSNTSATCTAGCSTQFYACNGPCLAGPNGTTLIPSLTTAGITNSPGQCLQNCSTQLQTCQRYCASQ